MEEEERQKSEEKPDEEQKDVNNETDNDKNTSKELKCAQKETVAEREDDVETTEYDISTDDESLRMIFSSTDQVIQDKYNSLCSPNPCFSPTAARSCAPAGPAWAPTPPYTTRGITLITLTTSSTSNHLTLPDQQE